MGRRKVQLDADLNDWLAAIKRHEDRSEDAAWRRAKRVRTIAEELGKRAIDLEESDWPAYMRSLRARGHVISDDYTNGQLGALRAWLAFRQTRITAPVANVGPTKKKLHSTLEDWQTFLQYGGSVTNRRGVRKAERCGVAKARDKARNIQAIMEAGNRKTPRTITDADVLKYLALCDARNLAKPSGVLDRPQGLSAGRRNVILTDVSQFATWAKIKNPAAEIARDATSPAMGGPVADEDQIRGLFRAARAEIGSGVPELIASGNRNLTLLMAMAECGMRSVAALSLSGRPEHLMAAEIKTDDRDEDGKPILVKVYRALVFDKYQEGRVPRYIHEELYNRLRLHGGAIIEPADNHGRRPYDQFIGWMRRNGVTNYGAHAFRRYVAVTMLKERGPLEVMELLQHSGLGITESYLRSLINVGRAEPVSRFSKSAGLAPVRDIRSQAG